jgi:hypothetical protein
MKMPLKNKILIVILTLGFFGVLGFALSGCNNFKVVRIEGQPDEVNDFYTVLSFYNDTKNPDSAFIGIVYTECQKARAIKRQFEKEKHYRDLIFGEGKTIDKTDYKKYTEYLERIK